MPRSGFRFEVEDKFDSSKDYHEDDQLISIFGGQDDENRQNESLSDGKVE